jgi:hypothetical protein
MQGEAAMGMTGLAMTGLAMWQAPDVINSGHAIWLEVFIAVAAIALLAQAVVVVAAAVLAMKAQKAITGHVLEIKAKAMPLMEKSQSLLEELSPKIASITANVEHISTVIREKVEEFEPTVSAMNVTVQEANATVRDVNAKTLAQVQRVNGMVTSVLSATSELGEKIHEGIRVPVREISGIVSGVKAGIDSLMSRGRGFGAGVRTQGFRSGSVKTEYGARPASSVVRPPTSAGVDSSASGEAAAAIAAFQRAEERVS